MILQSLVQYYEALEKKGEITRPGWCYAKVSYVLELSEEGELKRVVCIKAEKPQGKKMVLVPQMLKVPEMVTRTAGVSSNFLCDNSSYFLGVDKKGKPQRSLECFEAAGRKHKEIIGDVDHAAVRAVLRFFETWRPEQAEEHPQLKEYLDEIMDGANLIFEVDACYVHELPQVQEAWVAYRSRDKLGKRGICLVTGREEEIARTHGTIKGVQGAQSSGAALVSFNAPAFESFEKEQSFNAPVGVYAAYAYTTALNHLLGDKRHTTTIGDTTIVYWSEDAEEAYPFLFATAAEPTVDTYEIIDGVFKNLEAGKAINVPGVSEALSPQKKFTILGLSPNAARIAVRFFYQDSFGNILKHLKAHYDRMEIVRPQSDKTQYLGIWRMLQETVNKKSKDKKPVPGMAGAVYRAIISGGRYPSQLYQAVLGRIRAEQDDSDRGIYKITRGRAAVIKAFLLRNSHYNEEEITMALNEKSDNVAYTLGREFAVLEAIQEDANPGINATIKDKYFNSACTTPAAIFPILLKLKNSHTRKLNSKGKEIYYEKLLGELQDKLDAEGKQGIPRRMNLEEQGLFILGYYHQTQRRYEKKAKEET